MTTNHKKVGIIINEEGSEKHSNLWVSDYPENPERMNYSIKRCHDLGLIDRCLKLPIRKATESDILLKHTKELFDLVKSTKNMTEAQLKELSTKFDAVYFNQFTFEAAMEAVGCSLEAVEQVVLEKVDYSFAIVRPPGHHAMENECCGYCVFNNVAIAAEYALNTLNLKRVLIVDWDIHHGQGTQYMFYEDPRVLYFSTHRYERGHFWPNLRQSNYDYIGIGDGAGYNINVPFNEVGLTDSDMISVFQNILIPIGLEFNPELIIVSCGFDAVLGDPESRSKITPYCFAHLTNEIKSLSNGKLAIIFEGGYNLKSMSESMVWTLYSLLDDYCPDLGQLLPPLQSTKEVILNCIQVLRPFWKCLVFQDDIESRDSVNLDLQAPKSGVIFSTDENKPAVFDLNEFEKLSLSEKEESDLQIDAIIRNSNYSLPLNRTAIVYDEAMCTHCVRNGSHPERANRIKRIFSYLETEMLLPRCKLLPTRTATLEELSLVHKVDYIERVSSFSNLSDLELDDLEFGEMIHRSVYISKSSHECATMAVGCTLQLVDEILTEKSRNGFAIVRPPGHHAEEDNAMGFCFYNSVAIAAKYCLDKYKLKRILILDWDVHHGNGTQDAFINDNRVLFISIHRHDNGNFYPHHGDSGVNFVGDGVGEGFNINIPFSGGNFGDSEYIAAFNKIVLPVAYEFGPQIVLVSCGFDAAVGDTLGRYKVSPEAFGHMTRLLTSLAGGKLILVLEGGYNLVNVSVGAASCVSALLGDNLQNLNLRVPHANVVTTIKDVIKTHKKYWKSLAYDDNIPSRESTLSWLKKQHGHEFTLRKTSPSKSPSKSSSPSKHSRKTKTPPKHSIKSPPNAPAVIKERTAGASEIKKPPLTGEEAAGSGGASTTYPLSNPIRSLLNQMRNGQDQLELHAVCPLSWCPHVDLVSENWVDLVSENWVGQSAINIDTKAACDVCQEAVENWICLTCKKTLCSRYRNNHMSEHSSLTTHPMALSYSDLSTWCYLCDSYVECQKLQLVKMAAYRDKFNEEMVAMVDVIPDPKNSIHIKKRSL